MSSANLYLDEDNEILLLLIHPSEENKASIKPLLNSSLAVDQIDVGIPSSFFVTPNLLNSCLSFLFCTLTSMFLALVKSLVLGLNSPFQSFY